MTKTTKTIKFSAYHVNICTDIGCMFMMTKKQSVKQININKNVFSVLITLAIRGIKIHLLS
jgi:DUF2075 family protein